jgi:Sulfotransferase domain
MNHLKLLTDPQGLFITLDNQSSLYLKDKQGNITQERFPWIQEFLGVSSSASGYDVLYCLKNGQLAKWTFDSSGLKQKRQFLNQVSTNDLAHEFQLNPSALSSIQAAGNRYPQPEKLIIHCGYHKVATTFFSKILKKVAKEFGWKFQSGKQQDLKPETNIFIQSHSKVDLSLLPSYVGSHIIRDPRDMVISGYFYHLWTHEKWCHEKKEKYGNRSYQELLKSLPQEEGITREIVRMKGAIKNMKNWDYTNPNFLEIKLEDLAKNEKSIFEQIFQQYGFSQEEMELAMSVVDELSFEKRAGRERGKEDRNSHFRKGVSGDWKNHFTPDHKELFKITYPGTLVKLGYESDENW